MLKVDLLKCTGCTACFSICPVDAIEMKKNQNGFKYPVIDENRCIGCNKCDEVCLCYETKEIEHKNKHFYVAEHLDKKTHSYSQSGGISFGLGEEIIGRGGVVYGCAYDDYNVAAHIRIDNKFDLEKTRGSKYVQSDLKDTFRQIYQDLKDKDVLFTGTPCQVEGLYNYLECKRCSVDRLYTADIICHGVPSPLILKDFLLYVTKKYNSNVRRVNLRDKKFAPNVATTLLLDNGNTVQCDYYSELFYTNICLRECCGVCAFATLNRQSDITMGDIKGLDKKYMDSVNRSNPPSIVITHSKKGLDLLNKSEIKKIEIATSEFTQHNLHSPSKISPQKDMFWIEYEKKGFEYVLKKYTNAGGIKTKIKRKIMQKIDKW